MPAGENARFPSTFLMFVPEPVLANDRFFKMSPKTAFNFRTDPVDLFRKVESALLDPYRCRWRDHGQDWHVRHFAFEEFAHRSVDTAANLQLRGLVGWVEGEDAARITRRLLLLK